MRYSEFATMLGTVGIPYAYYQFPEGTDLKPPFLCFYFQGGADVYADNINYQKIEDAVIELYTDDKDFELENTLETTLTSNGFAFSRSETYLSAERMHMQSYYTEVLITPEPTSTNTEVTPDV